MAVRFPYRFRDMPNRDLMDEIRHANDLHYVLLSGEGPRDAHRFPNEGWIQGSVTDIATAIRIGAMPTSEVVKAAYDLEYGVDEAAKLLEDAIEERPEIGRQIEDILHQESGLQTSRMAMLILTNAFVFQSSLAQKPGLKDVPALGQFTSINHRLDPTHILDAWNKIWLVNYRPIFDVAIRLVEALASDDELVGQVLWGLRETARKLINKGLAQVHELAGIVFQRLIVDRKFIKTYYTRPESVALLSALVLPDRDFVDESPETIRTSLSECKIADYACGTGALLNGVYQRLLGLYEQAGGDGKALHKNMVEQNLWGYDIMPNASHLTAALITSNFPDVRIGKTRIEVMEYATRLADGRWALGALDLIENPEGTLPINLMNPQRVQGDASPVDISQSEFRHGEMDVVVDNPPFTRVGADNKTGVPKSVFGDQDPAIAKEMIRALRKIKDSIGNSNAGFGSYFVDLADRMLKDNGQSVMGFVLPITALTAPHWQKVRDLWAQEYHDVIVVTIADAKTEDCAFSADTNIAECLIIATKGISENTGRGTFVSLYRRPDNHLEAVEITKEIHNLRSIRQLEDPPIGGDSIKVGNEIGQVLDCPLQKIWTATRIRDFSLIQSAYHLANGQLWLVTQPDFIEIPMVSVEDIATVGFNHRTIKDPSFGAFDMKDGCSDTDLYPGLWHIDSDNQRAMVVETDCHGVIRSGYYERAQEILVRSSRVHHNASLRFNANSLSVLFTERSALGISSVVNVVFANSDHDYVWTLWSNSTLGLLCYWMHSSKRYAGRGRMELTVLHSLPTLNVRKLDETAVQNAKYIFEEIKSKRMLPFNQINEDEVRWELDRLLLSKVLGFGEDTHPEVHEGVRILRERLCAEPSIHGGKKSKVVL